MADDQKPGDEPLKLTAGVAQHTADVSEKPVAIPKPDTETTDEKIPPDPEQVRALLQMAEMQSMGGTAGRKSPFKPLIIVLIIIVLLCVGSYFAVLWAIHHP